jgi:hypothetical protein
MKSYEMKRKVSGGKNVGCELNDDVVLMETRAEERITENVLFLYRGSRGDF